MHRTLNYFLKPFLNRFEVVYKDRLAEILAGLIPSGALVLDVGCNDGRVSMLIKDRRPDLNFVGIDIQDKYKCGIPRKIYDGKRMPFDDCSFDVAMAIDVLHHTKSMRPVLGEMKRVSKKYLLIKELYSENRLIYYVHCFTDWITNAPYGISCTNNFPSKKRQFTLYEEQGLEVIEDVKPLSLGFGIGEGTNFVVKLKISARDG